MSKRLRNTELCADCSAPGRLRRFLLARDQRRLLIDSLISACSESVFGSSVAGNPLSNLTVLVMTATEIKTAEALSYKSISAICNPISSDGLY